MQRLGLCDNVAVSTWNKAFERRQPKFNLTSTINVQASLQTDGTALGNQRH